MILDTLDVVESVDFGLGSDFDVAADDLVDDLVDDILSIQLTSILF